MTELANTPALLMAGTTTFCKGAVVAASVAGPEIAPLASTPQGRRRRRTSMTVQLDAQFDAGVGILFDHQVGRFDKSDGATVDAD